MLLDTFDEVFVWVGNGANEAEKKAALQLAFVRSSLFSQSCRTMWPLPWVEAVLPTQQACSSSSKEGSHHPSQRTSPPGTVIFGRLLPLHTPQSQMAYNYESLKRQLANISSAPSVTTVKDALSIYSKTHPIEVLRLPADQLPEGVDPTHKEVPPPALLHFQAHLTDTDFEAVFQMSRSAYQALPSWKQTDAKRKAGLF